MKTTVVCGMLGAGKTTFLQNALAGETGGAVVLVNDFGELGVDGEVLSTGGIETIELRSGCVCCTLKTDLTATLKQVLEELRPEHLLIEPSGVATPVGVLEVLDRFGVAPVTVVGIVDSTDFARLWEAQLYGQFFEDQITHSDVVLVNKTDLADTGAVREAVDLVSRINPRAVVVPTVGARLDGTVTATGRKTAPQGHGHSLGFETVSLRLPESAELARCERLFQRLAEGEFGAARRAKALVQTEKGPYRLDLSSGRVDAAEFGSRVEKSRLVVIGEGLDEPAIRAAAGEVSA